MPAVLEYVMCADVVCHMMCAWVARMQRLGATVSRTGALLCIPAKGRHVGVTHRVLPSKASFVAFVMS